MHLSLSIELFLQFWWTIDSDNLLVCPHFLKVEAVLEINLWYWVFCLDVYHGIVALMDFTLDNPFESFRKIGMLLRLVLFTVRSFLIVKLVHFFLIFIDFN